MGLRLGILGCACLLLFGFLLFGCTSAEEVESETQKAAEEVESEVREAVEEPIDTIEVQETEFRLDPSEITLDRPGTYVFRAVNAGNVVHALAIQGQGIEEETPNIQPGESAELEVNLDPGTYKLYCPVGNHEQRGQVGTVTVRAS